MRQIPLNSRSIAWFKLAEFVLRGEKERAFGVYKLLIHSFNDSALALQLEGDLYLAFDEKEKAVCKYIAAASIYYESKRMIEAMAVYELLIQLKPESEFYVVSLVDLYSKLGVKAKVASILKNFFELLFENKDFDKASEVLVRFSEIISIDECSDLHKRLLFSLFENGVMSDSKTLLHTRGVLEGLVHKKCKKNLDGFLEELKDLNTMAYDYAYTYLKRID